MIIFQIFKNKPTITSLTDVLNNEPDRFYYRVHSLPIPDHLKDEEDFPRESTGKPSPRNYVDAVNALGNRARSASRRSGCIV
jgi:hypothetical protein